MLKRRRGSSPIPWSMEPTVEADVAPSDLYEPDRKRRRYFTAAKLDKSHWTDSANDDWEGESDDGEYVLRKRREGSSRGANEWQQQAGQYKDANTMLHELHAEQRHRMIFSVPSSTNSTLHAYIPVHDAPSSVSSQGTSSPEAVGTVDYLAHRQPFIVEAKQVAKRYEETNRFLGSLVLSRRQKSSPATSEPTSAS
ncbi:hypothetical protein BC835DRAFT_1363370 [Cytidiella melzeri]|nr:hypothetical protein BC835DRAFT_1363370 [Cytidiella melzeri]